MNKEEAVALIDEIIQLHELKSVRELAAKLGIPPTTLLTWYGGKVSLVGELFLKEHKQNLQWEKLVGEEIKTDMEKIKYHVGKLHAIVEKKGQ